MLLLLITTHKTIAQYYYKDIWNPRQLANEMAILKNEKIRLVSVKSFEEDGEPSPGFFCEKKLSRDYSLSETMTRSYVTSPSLLSTYFNSEGLIAQTTDSSESSVNKTQYQYDDNDKIVMVKTLTRADNDSGSIGETHSYFYNTKAVLEKMTRTKNNAEISTVNFKPDEKGNIIEEEELFKNGDKTKYFYYYDDKNHLTDVVHYNYRAKRLLPDYMHEYNSTGQIKQMISVEEGGGYYIWKYTYNDKRLRETERCFSKEKKLLGSIEYVYK
jgi:hypothetical protein